MTWRSASMTLKPSFMRGIVHYPRASRGRLGVRGFTQLGEEPHEGRHLVVGHAAAGFGQQPQFGQADGLRLEAHTGFGAVESEAISGHAEESHDAWPEPAGFGLELPGARADLIGGELIGRGAGPL